MSDQLTQHGVVVGVDGSPASRVAVDWAARDAALRDLPLTVVNVYSPASAQTWIDVALPFDAVDFEKGRSAETLADAQAVVDEACPDLVVHTKSVFGSPVGTLVEFSRSADLVVVGGTGKSAVARALLGSVSTGLVHHAHCPVAVIHDEDPVAGNPAEKPVAVGVDGSPASEKAVELAFAEASLRGVDLVAVHTWHDVDYEFPDVKWTDLRPRGERILSERLAGWCERYPDVTVNRVLVRDRPAHQLLEQGRSAQLLVVGSRGRGGFTGMLLGSVSTAVVQAARMPVIVAR
jgi:nucleotide-binding universal stress UspA family protein